MKSIEIITNNKEKAIWGVGDKTQYWTSCTQGSMEDTERGNLITDKCSVPQSSQKRKL